MNSTIFPDMHSNVFCLHLHFMSKNWPNKSRRKTDGFSKCQLCSWHFSFYSCSAASKPPQCSSTVRVKCFIAQPLRYSRETFKSVETLMVRNNNLRSGGLRRLGFTAGIDFVLSPGVMVPTSPLTCWSAFTSGIMSYSRSCNPVDCQYSRWQHAPGRPVLLLVAST